MHFYVISLQIVKATNFPHYRRPQSMSKVLLFQGRKLQLCKMIIIYTLQQVTIVLQTLSGILTIPNYHVSVRQGQITYEMLSRFDFNRQYINKPGIC